MGTRGAAVANVAWAAIVVAHLPAPNIAMQYNSPAADCAAFLAATPMRIGSITKASRAYIPGPGCSRDLPGGGAKLPCLRAGENLQLRSPTLQLSCGLKTALRRQDCLSFGKAWRRSARVVLGNSKQAGGDSAVAEMAGESQEELTVETVNLQGFKKEVARQSMRQIKKVSKAEVRLRKAEEAAANGKNDFEEDMTPEVLEVALRLEVDRMEQISDLEAQLFGIKNAHDQGLLEILAVANKLGISDSKPEEPSRGPKKPKGKQGAPRKPYFVYEAKDGTEIWVGRKAEDNDVLTMELRDPENWWLHASGCPGSHVVIRTTDNTVEPQVVQDAACLALHFSQAGGGKQKISLTRCRDVTKPSGFPAGRVLLRGDVTTIKMHLKEEAGRLERLLATKRLG